MSRPPSLTALAAGLFLGFGACADGGGSVTDPNAAQAVNTIEVTSSGDTVVTGKTLQLTAQAKNSSGQVVSGKQFAWSSDNEALARVDASGVVVGVAEGQVRISASVDGKTGGKTLRVRPGPSFTLEVTPALITGRPDWPSDSLVITVRGHNGFADSVAVTIQGLPAGATTSIPVPMWVHPGRQAVLRFTTPAVTSPRDYPLSIKGSAGTATHEGSATLSIVPNTRAYQRGRHIVLERFERGRLVHVAVDSLWGGLVTDAGVDGVNVIDRADPGRGIGLSFGQEGDKYDNCSGCEGVHGWNLVQGGDEYSNGSPILAKTVSAAGIYIKTQPLQWNPDDKGGGRNTPILGDMYVEQTLEPVPEDVNLFKLHYKITHFGTDDHGLINPEFPCLYTIPALNRFVYYSGSSPWTGDAVSFSSVTEGLDNSVMQSRYAPEKWAAWVDSEDNGITLWAPRSYPYVIGHRFPDTNYAVPGQSYFWLKASTTWEWEAYIYVGDYKAARQRFASMRQAITPPDALSPFGMLDFPTEGSEISGTTQIVGWVLDNLAVEKIEVWVDDTLAGSTVLNTSRTDVQTDFPWAPTVSGYMFPLDTRPFSNGAHTITIRALDASGNSTRPGSGAWPSRQSVTIKN